MRAFPVAFICRGLEGWLLESPLTRIVLNFTI